MASPGRPRDRRAGTAAKEAATVDGVVALVLDGLRTGRRELRYDLQKAELTLR